MENNEKSLILVHCRGQWIPFKDIDQWKEYRQKFEDIFNNIPLEDIRVFDAKFKEIKDY